MTRQRALFAPHGDDEIIGCYNVLTQFDSQCIVYYGEFDDGCGLASKWFNFRYEMFDESLAIEIDWDIVYAPDPSTEYHPLHQHFGQLAQRLFRQGKIERLIFYTTRMSVPYIFEEPYPQEKRAALDGCYPHKSELWKFDHRYWLFCGYWELLRPVHT